jgi:CheY-like chemotaxis protein
MPTAQSIMIIDDDPDDIEVFFDAVREIDATIKCHSAKNGQEGLKVLKGLPDLPDFIFLDLNMPKMNGKQCLAELKKNANFRDIPVIIYSTSKIKDDIDECIRMGAICFLTKPSKFSVLKSAISSVLKKNWIKLNEQVRLL